MKRFFLAMSLFLAPVIAQSQVTNEPVPQITVVGRGETKISPDRANIQISVQTRAATASAAGAAKRNQTACGA